MTPATLRNPSSVPSDPEEASRTPLLGPRGDTSSGEEASAPTKTALLLGNLFGGGRAMLTQIGCLLLLASVMSVIVPNPAGLFSYHPPLQSLAIVLFAQGILTLQPTRTKPDKARGLALHQIFQIAGLASIAAGISIMIANKALHGAPHFKSWHGKFGLVSSILLVIQAMIGTIVSVDPGMRMLGGEGNAKSLWKYHRASGYVTLPLAIVTASLATTRADWIMGHSSMIQRVLMTAGLACIAVGLWSRMSLQKLGIKTS